MCSVEVGKVNTYVVLHVVLMYCSTTSRVSIEPLNYEEKQRRFTAE
jgi:hypothetical protein